MSGKPKYVAPETLRKILDLRSANFTLRKIADEVGIPSERVRHILSVNGSPKHVPITLDYTTYNQIDPRWMDEFRGFFLGEGCCTIYHNTTNPHFPNYRPDLHLGVRDDDAEIIYDIQKHLGGVATRHNRGSRARSHPGIQWQLIGWRRLTNLLPILLDGSLPGKKRKDISLLNELCQKRKTWPYNLSAEHVEELRKYYVALQEVKRYKGSEG